MKKNIEIDMTRIYNDLLSLLPSNKNEYDSYARFIFYELNIIDEQDIDFFNDFYDNLTTIIKNKIFNILNICENRFEDSIDEVMKLLLKNMDNDIEDFFVNIPYHIFLNSHYWLFISKYKKIKSYNKCQLCNSTIYLNTHHKDYKNRGKEYKNLDDLIVLCNKCHVKFHNKG
jgi:hypothetical protein